MPRVLLILLLSLFLALPRPGQAQSPAAPAAPAAASGPAITQSQAQHTLDILRDDKRRADLIGTLETIAKAMPVTEPKPTVVTVEPDSLAARTLLAFSRFGTHLSDQARTTFFALQQAPDTLQGITDVASDPVRRERLLDAVWRLLAVLVAGLTAQWAVQRLLKRPRNYLARQAPGEPVAHRPGHPPEPPLDPLPPEADAEAEALAVEAERAELANGEGDADAVSGIEPFPPHRRRVRNATSVTFLRRLPLGLERLVLDLLPIAAFLIVAHFLLGTPLGGADVVRLVVMSLIDAYAIFRGVMCVVQMMLSPDSPRLRLLHLSDGAAASMTRWAARIIAVTIFGLGIAGAGLLLGMTQDAHDALLKGVSLLVHVMLILVVLECRPAVARRLRPHKDATGLWASACAGLAAVWHIVAIFLLVATWLVWAVELPNGFSRLMHFTLVSAAILLVSRLALIVVLGTLDRLARRRPEADTATPLQLRVKSYGRISHVVMTGLIYVATLVALLESWGFGSLAWLAGAAGRQLLSISASMGITMVIALVVWEWANIAAQTRIAQLNAQQQQARSARLRTLLPLLRTALLTTLLIFVGLIVLSEIGVNIAPLLAGAGVLGIAIGFGSQKLVQDVITGLFLLLENTMQVGDVVSTGGLSGVVEYLSIRSIRLRAEDGSVHVIPFSAVTTVTNMTRDFGHAVIEAQVSYEDDYDKVVAVLRGIVAEMREEPRWSSEIRDDLEVLGLDKFESSAIVIKARIRVGPFGRWAVLREFNRRMKQRFDEHGIEIPYPHQQLVVANAAVATPLLPPKPRSEDDAAAAANGPTPEEADAKAAIAREAATR